MNPQTRRNPVGAEPPNKAHFTWPSAAALQQDEPADWRDSSLDLLRGLEVIDLDVEEALIAVPAA